MVVYHPKYYSVPKSLKLKHYPQTKKMEQSNGQDLKQKKGWKKARRRGRTRRRSSVIEDVVAQLLATGGVPPLQVRTCEIVSKGDLAFFFSLCGSLTWVLFRCLEVRSLMERRTPGVAVVLHQS